MQEAAKRGALIEFLKDIEANTVAGGNGGPDKRICFGPDRLGEIKLAGAAEPAPPRKPGRARKFCACNAFERSFPA